MKSTAKVIRVLIAEDHLIARLGMSAIINAQQRMRIVAEARTGQEAVALYRQHRPDVVLMDIRMPLMDGVDATSRIRREFPDARIVAISTFAGDYDVRAALNAGAVGYLNKDVMNEELIVAIQAAHAGEVYLPLSIQAALSGKTQVPNLTAREMEVLNLIVQGLSNKQISYTLGIAEYTVKNHVKSILGKLEASDRTHAATVAIRRGLIHIL